MGPSAPVIAAGFGAHPGTGFDSARPERPAERQRQRQRLDLPRSTRRYRFSMTAMADMMFQLLVFFMLSTTLASYSMLDIASGRLAGSTAGTETAAADPRPIPAADSRATAVWTVQSDGAILASGQRFAPDRLPMLAEALKAQGTPNLLVVVRPDVALQRLVAVLELLAAHDLQSVQIARGAGPQATAP